MEHSARDIVNTANETMRENVGIVTAPETVKTDRAIEWPTLVLLAGTYAVWGVAVFGIAGMSTLLAFFVLIPAIAFHSSLTHEAVHGHPFRNSFVNAALLFPSLSLFVPYERFKATHLAHHQDERLTDPYDDPESNYLDPAVWGRMARPVQAVLNVNNTLLGRMLIGPFVGQIHFMYHDARAAMRGDRDVILGWMLHIPAVAITVWGVAHTPLSFGVYFIAAYFAYSILKIRTFLEHRAHEKARARTVVIEDRGLLSFLFLNNNLHVVHHMHPKVAWYDLPALYRARKDHYLRRNDGYMYRSYAEVFGRYFLRAKDPVPHPLWPKD